MIVRAAVLAFLALSSSVQAAPFELTPPGMAETTIVSAPALAANSDGYLAIWAAGEQGDLSGALIDADGRRRVPSAIGVLAMPPNGWQSKIAALVRVGQDYLLEIGDADYTFTASEFFLLDSHGKPKGPWTAEVALDRYLLAASTPRGDRLLFIPKAPRERDAIVLDERGAVVRRFQFTYDYRNWLDWTPPVASSDREFVLSWRDEHGVHIQRIPTDGGDSPVVTVAPGQPFTVWSAVATDGDDVLIVYEQRQDDVATAMKIAKVTSDNRVVPVTGFRAPSAWAAAASYPPEIPFSLRWTGDHYVFVRTSTRTWGVLEAIRFGADGTALDQEPRVVATNIGRWKVANRGDRFYITGSSELSPGYTAIVGFTFRTAGSITGISKETLSNTSASQMDARVATDGVHFMTVWKEITLGHTSRTGEMRAAAFTAAGETVAAIDFPQVLDFWLHDVASAGGVYAVVWSSNDSLYALRVTSSGTILDAQPVVIVTGLAHLRSLNIASNGSRFLVVWSTDTRFEAATLSPDGVVGPLRSVRGGPAPRSGAELGIGCCSVASDGEDFLLLWVAREYYPRLPSDHIISLRTEGIRVAADGTPASALPKIVADGFFAGPLVWNGSEYAYVHWSGSKSAMLRRVSRYGDPIGQPMELLFPEWGLQMLDLKVSGGEYVLAFRTSPELYVSRNQIVRLRDEGNVRGHVFGEPNSGYAEDTLQLAMNAAGQIIAVVNEFRPDAFGVRSRRTVAYPVNDLAPAPPRRRAASR